MLVISKMVEDERSGHLIEDERFYYKFLLGRSRDFDFYVSRFSRKYFHHQYPGNRARIFSLEKYDSSFFSSVRLCFSLRRLAQNEQVVFFGYTEPFILVFLALNFFKNPKLTLIATNNFSAGRCLRKTFAMRAAYSVLKWWIECLIVHTDREILHARRLVRARKIKIVSKKHHLLTPRVRPTTRPKANELTISFFGPSKIEKPVEPLIDLILADECNFFSYNLFNAGIDVSGALMQQLLGKSNVKIFNGWLSKEEYEQAVVDSSLIFLTHTRSFEGKLSGNLCDCLSFSIPFVSLPIEPVLEFQSRYGDLGFLVNFSEKNWPISFLEMNFRDRIELFHRNLYDLKTDYSHNKVLQSLSESLAHLLE